MIQDADAANDLFHELDLVLEATAKGVGGIADNGIALGSALGTFDSNDLVVFKENLVDISIEHEGSSVDSTNSAETFWNASKTEDRVDEGRRVLSHRVHIELDLADKFNRRAAQERVVSVEGDCVTNEIHSVLFKVVFFEHFST